MTTLVFLAVLFAALCHAGWNGLVKTGLDPLATTTLITLGSAAVALPMLPFAGLPEAAAWPWLVASAGIHLFYFAGLIESYRAGDLGQVYPIARGTAPLLTASTATVALGERLGFLGWAGIVLLASGVLLLSFRGGRDVSRFDRRAVGFALFTALTVCAYSVVDGIGVRLSGNPAAYVFWLFIGFAFVLPPYARWREGAGLFKPMLHVWRRGVLGGGMQVLSYGIALWAMTLAPIGIVAALRETSVLFGAVIAVVLLNEPLRVLRILAAMLIVGGLVLIRLQ